MSGYGIFTERFHFTFAMRQKLTARSARALRFRTSGKKKPSGARTPEGLDSLENPHLLGCITPYVCGDALLIGIGNRLEALGKWHHGTVCSSF